MLNAVDALVADRSIGRTRIFVIPEKDWKNVQSKEKKAVEWIPEIVAKFCVLRQRSIVDEAVRGKI